MDVKSRLFFKLYRLFSTHSIFEAAAPLVNPIKDQVHKLANPGILVASLSDICEENSSKTYKG